jgi:hypothetical protein
MQRWSVSKSNTGENNLNPEMGELAVGAYLKLCSRCAFVDYNVRPPGGGLEGLGELDVVGLDPDAGRAFLCEVTTHIRGLLYTSNTETVERIRKKHARQREYAAKHLKAFPQVTFMFWSPVVPVGCVTEGLAKIEGLQLVVNQEYARRISELRELARTAAHDSGNDFFRVLQILEHLRG